MVDRPLCPAVYWLRLEEAAYILPFAPRDNNNYKLRLELRQQCLVIVTKHERTHAAGNHMSLQVDVSAPPAGSPPPSTPPSPPLASDEALAAAAKQPAERKRRTSKEALMAVATRVGKALALPEGAEPAFCD